MTSSPTRKSGRSYGAKPVSIAAFAADPAVSATDVEQHLVEQLLRRLPAYDPGRGTAIGFAVLVGLHAIADFVEAAGHGEASHAAGSTR